MSAKGKSKSRYGGEQDDEDEEEEDDDEIVMEDLKKKTGNKLISARPEQQKPANKEKQNASPEFNKFNLFNKKIKSE